MSTKTKKDIFRKVALERLSSPEQLDLTMEVTRPRSWMVLGALGVLLATLVIWGFVGSIPTRVSADAVLIQSGGVFNIFASGTGPVTEVLMKEDELVTQGQVVARIDQPDIEASLQNAIEHLKELENQHKELSSYTEKDFSLQSESLVLRRATLEGTVEYTKQRLAALEEQIAREEALLERGLITRQTVLQTRQAFYAATDQREQALNDLKQLDVSDLSITNRKEQQLLQSQLAINETERSIRVLKDQLAALSEVRSPYSGRILEVQVRRGDVIARGSSVAILQLSDQKATGLEAIVYVPPEDGKYVEAGMEVQISPLSAPREEYGFMLGRVTYVSDFPATRAGMLRVLANDVLVNSLMATGVPFSVYADLTEDAESANGYKWSSNKGHTMKVNSGTLCRVTITVRERRPIELVIPLLRRLSGI